MADIIDFASYRNRELIEILRETLGQAEAGKVSGAILVLKIGKRDHGVAVVGDYEGDPRKICDLSGEIFIHFQQFLPEKATIIE